MTDPRTQVSQVSLRRALAADADRICDVYLESFRATYDFPLAHSDDEVRNWLAGDVLPRRETWLAEADGRIVAMMVLEDHGIDQLYVEPGWHGRGIGSDLIRLAKRQRPTGLELYTFQVNDRARRFYEHRGFEVAAVGDGSGNEEHQPDVLYRWRP